MFESESLAVADSSPAGTSARPHLARLQLRALYQSVVRLMMAGDAAALRAADAESRSVQPGLGSMAAAQQAAVSAAVHTLA